MASSINMLGTAIVKRKKPVLVSPAKPTPHEFKPLSDIDVQESLRFQVPIVFYYRSRSCKKTSITTNTKSIVKRIDGDDDDNDDPVPVIKRALSEALVYFYPLAGRLREMEGRKLVVECTGEGVLFVEADADLRLDQFGFGEDSSLIPPAPFMEELLYDVPGSTDILNCPLLLVQVTQLLCGGFVFGFRVNHTICDAFGIALFLNTVAEMARGACTPSVPPVWHRHLLSARGQICHHHHHHHHLEEYEKAYVPPHDSDKSSMDQLATISHQQRAFFLGPCELAALRRHLPHQNSYTTFEIIAACFWKCRTASLGLRTDDVVRFMGLVNLRGRTRQIPKGYYGNCIVFPAAVTTAGELRDSPLQYAVELVRKAKQKASSTGGEEYMQAVIEHMVSKGRPHYNRHNAFFISDVRLADLQKVDFGWGEAVFGGPAKPMGEISFCISAHNYRAEQGIVVLISLPESSIMDAFVRHLYTLVATTTLIPVSS